VPTKDPQSVTDRRNDEAPAMKRQSSMSKAAYARRLRRWRLPWEHLRVKMREATGRPTAADVRVAEALDKDRGLGPVFLKRVMALTAGEARAFWDRTHPPEDPRIAQVVTTAMSLALSNPQALLELPALLEERQLARQGRPDVITPVVAALATEFQHEKPRILWGRLAERLGRLGWLRSDQGKRINAELHAPDGRVLTYPNFVKRLDRARAAPKGKPKK